MEETEIIKRILKTGKVSLGSKRVEKLLKTGKPKLVILSDNCPKELEEDIKHNAKIAGVRVYTFGGGSLKLGEVCGKPFPISAMAVLDQGKADINKLKKG